MGLYCSSDHVGDLTRIHRDCPVLQCLLTTFRECQFFYHYLALFTSASPYATLLVFLYLSKIVLLFSILCRLLFSYTYTCTRATALYTENIPLDLIMFFFVKLWFDQISSRIRPYIDILNRVGECRVT